MYSIRIDNIEDLKFDSSAAIGIHIKNRANEILKKNNIQLGGIDPFPGKKDYFVMYDAEMINPVKRKNKDEEDRLLSYSDWKRVNDAINDVLDEMGIYGTVKSNQFIVRRGKNRKFENIGKSVSM